MPLAVLPANQRIRLVIPHDLLRLRIEVDPPADTRGDVPEVCDRRRPVADLDVRIRPRARADAVEEVAVVQRAVQLSGDVLDWLVLRPERLVPTLAIQDQIPLRAVV